MKKRVEEIQSFHNPPRATRLITPPQHNNSNAGQSQYQILNVIRDQSNVTAVTAATQNIQYTYSSSISTANAPNAQKTNLTAQQSQNQPVHVINSGNISLSARPKQTSVNNITPTSITVSNQSPGSASTPSTPQGGQNFPRLKVEDALSYLDQVKYKFGNQPQVYNDFLDIMKEFKSQSIDTPGVIQRVSNLFKGHPELIVGFNTFLPPGYKIEVQANDQGFAYQVSVSVPSPSGNNTSIHTQHSPPSKFIQNTSHILNQPSVNIIPHSVHQQNIHIQPTPQQEQRTNVQSQNLTNINLAQTFPRTEKNIQSANLQTSQPPQQQQQQPQTQQHNASSVQHPLNESPNLHRIQPIFQNDNQPVQFNQAIVYVNKIKNRFQEQPEKYKHFLRILHKYQNEQRRKDSSGKASSPLTETEVFKQVANLFDNQEDLLREFGQFLPDASPASSNVLISKTSCSNQNESNDKLSSLIATQHINSKQTANNASRNNILSLEYQNTGEKEFNLSYGSSIREKDSNRNNISTNNQKYGNMNASGVTLKRSPGIQINHINRPHDRNEPPLKRHKPIRDVSYADAARSGTLQDYAFFDKVREALRTSDVYDNFLRCLTLYNQEVVSKSELITLVTPFLSKEPELLKRFQEFLKFSISDSIPYAVAQRQDHRIQTDTAAEIDVAQCKRLGTSYCALPKTSELKKCSGRTPLCREVLNDTWVSFPSWSEDSTFNTSRKTQYEEFIYRCEDERFELDVVIETNSATIRVLEGVQKKMSKMSSDELSRFKLDDSLGGTSQTIHQRALRRIYGEKASDIIEGLKKNPNVAVPVVLRRLKAKEEEWREAQKGFNQQWREQNEKYYLKSLDHQGINFKHTDTKALRSKSLMNQIETAYEERNESNNGEIIGGPHIILPYKDKSILDDAANLLIHHVKRQTGIQKLEKARIKHILRQFIPELFFAPRQPLSDDEKEDVEDKESTSGSDSKTKLTTISMKNNSSSQDNCITEKINITNELSDTNKKDSAVPNHSKNANNSTNEPINANINSDYKIEIKDEPETIQVGSKADNIGQALGSNALPLHAVNSKHPDEAYTLFYANSNWYYFLRLHAILCERLRTMYERTQIMAAEEEKYRNTRRESVAVALRLKPQNEFEIADYYPGFLDMLKSLLDGNMDASTYEDKLRDMFGIHAYIAFTLDRVVSNAVRQLQFCVTERNALECYEIYQMERRNNSTGGLCSTAFKRAAAELSYQRRIESNLQEEMFFKIFIYKIESKVTIEMLENDTEDISSVNFEQGQGSSKYIERLTNPANMNINSSNGTLFNDVKLEKFDNLTPSARKLLFLPRNIRQFNRKLLTNELKIENVESSLKKNPPQEQDVNAAESACTLTTSSSSVPPPLIIPKLPDSFCNVSERIAHSNIGDYFVDDQEQVKINYQTYKTVFCNTINKGYILYRYNSLKNSKTTHPKITRCKDQRFENFNRKWLLKNVNETDKNAVTDWFMGINQTEFVPCKTSIRNDNNILKTPYCIYNRYRVEYISNVDHFT